VNERKNLVGGLLLGGLGALLLYKLFRWRRFDDERPPIRVRGGSVVFENQLVVGESESRDWISSGDRRDWKPEHPEGKRVTEFVVSVVRPSGRCVPMRGHVVMIRRTPANTPPLHVNIVDGEPVVGPKNQLDVNNGLTLKTISYDAGDLVSVAVGSDECNLTRDSEVWIWPR
jgi:hypothetical protein